MGLSGYSHCALCTTFVQYKQNNEATLRYIVNALYFIPWPLRE